MHGYFPQDWDLAESFLSSRLFSMTSVKMWTPSLMKQPYWKCNFPISPFVRRSVGRSVGHSVGRSVGRSFIISLMAGQSNFHRFLSTCSSTDDDCTGDRCTDPFSWPGAWRVHDVRANRFHISWRRILRKCAENSLQMKNIGFLLLVSGKLKKIRY